MNKEHIIYPNNGEIVPFDRAKEFVHSIRMGAKIVQYNLECVSKDEIRKFFSNRVDVNYDNIKKDFLLIYIEQSTTGMPMNIEPITFFVSDTINRTII